MIGIYKLDRTQTSRTFDRRDWLHRRRSHWRIRLLRRRVYSFLRKVRAKRILLARTKSFCAITLLLLLRRILYEQAIRHRLPIHLLLHPRLTSIFAMHDHPLISHGPYFFRIGQSKDVVQIRSDHGQAFERVAFEGILPPIPTQSLHGLKGIGARGLAVGEERENSEGENRG